MWAQIYTGHHKPAGERVTIAVPSVAVEMGGILPREPEPPLRTNVEQHGAHHAVHRHLPGSTVLRASHRDQATQQVRIPPTERHLLTPPEPGVKAEREQRTQLGRQHLAKRRLLLAIGR